MAHPVYDITFVGFDDEKQVQEAAAALNLEERTLRDKLAGLVGKGGDKKFYRAVSYEKLKPHTLGRDGIESDIYVLNNHERFGSSHAPDLQDVGTNIHHYDDSTLVLAYFAATRELRDRQGNGKFKPIEGRTGTLAKALENYQKLIPGDAKANRVPGESTVHTH